MDKLKLTLMTIILMLSTALVVISSVLILGREENKKESIGTPGNTPTFSKPSQGLFNNLK